MSKRVKFLIAAGFAAFLAYILFSPMRLGKVSCEVCMEFNGKKVCRSAKGPGPEEATATARDNACAQVAFGREESIRCGATPPASVKCGD